MRRTCPLVMMKPLFSLASNVLAFAMMAPIVPPTQTKNNIPNVFKVFLLSRNPYSVELFITFHGKNEPSISSTCYGLQNESFTSGHFRNTTPSNASVAVCVVLCVYLEHMPFGGRLKHYFLIRPMFQSHTGSKFQFSRTVSGDILQSKLKRDTFLCFLAMRPPLPLLVRA